MSHGSMPSLGVPEVRCRVAVCYSDGSRDRRLHIRDSDLQRRPWK